MKNLFTLLALFVSINWGHAENIQINISGNTYSPSEVKAKVGDQITISASSFHPLAQVSKTTWMADGTALLAGGFGEKTSSYSFTVNAADTIYYVCTAHVGLGMKGKIIVEQQSTDIAPEQTQEASFSVYPNPVSQNRATVTLRTFEAGTISLSLTSLDGRWKKVMVQHDFYSVGVHEFPLQTDGLTPGMYILSYVAGEQRGKLLLNILR